MQGLLDSPRQAFAAQDVLNGLGWAPVVAYDAGYELLDGNDNPVYDLSDYLTRAGSYVERDCNAAVHGSCLLNTEYPHNWGVDRVKIYYLIACDSVPLGPIRFDLGIFTLTAPGQQLGTDAPLYPATGYDKLYLLNTPIGDAYNIATGAAVLATARSIILSVTGSSHIIADGVKEAATVADPGLTWSVDDAGSVTWLQVVNALLDLVGYRPLWCDQNGYYRSELYVDPATRPAEAIFGAGDTALSRYLDPLWRSHVVVTDGNRSINRSAWNQPNWWRFIQAGLSFQPTEGAGQYTVQNLTAGPTGQQSAGRVVKAPVQSLQATGQADLQAQGDLIVARQIATAETLPFSTAPWPLAGHFDVMTFADPTLPGQETRRVVAQTWRLPLDGKDMDWSTNIAQQVDGGLWVGADPPQVPSTFYPPPTLGGSYHPPTPHQPTAE